MRKNQNFSFRSILSLMLIIVLLFIVGCTSKKDEGNKETKTNGLIVEYSKYPGVDLITDITDKEKYHVAKNYPNFKNKELDKEIEDYVSSDEKDFLTAVDENRNILKIMYSLSFRREWI